VICKLCSERTQRGAKKQRLPLKTYEHVVVGISSKNICHSPRILQDAPDLVGVLRILRSMQIVPGTILIQGRFHSSHAGGCLVARPRDDVSAFKTPERHGLLGFYSLAEDKTPAPSGPKYEMCSIE